MKALLAADELSLEAALRIADAMEPALAAERRNVDLAAAAILEARLYPNPSLFVEVEDYHTEGPTAGRMDRVVGLSIPIVVSDRLGAASAVADKEREVAALEYVWRRREVLAGVRRAFLAALGARQAAELARESRDIAADLHEATKARFEAEAAPEMELLKSSVDLARSEADVRLAVREAEKADQALGASMGEPDLPRRRIAGRLATRFQAPDLDALRRAVAERHPLLEAAERRREAAALGVDLARSLRYADPEFEISGGLDAEDRGILTAGLTFPLPLFDPSRPRVAAAETRAVQATLRARAVRNELVLRVGTAHREFEAARERVESYEAEILPQARRALEQTREGWAAGKFGRLDVLDAQRTLAEARSLHLSAVLELNLAASELEFLTGVAVTPVP